jgi:two-component system response regulator TctD
MVLERPGPALPFRRPAALQDDPQQDRLWERTDMRLLIVEDDAALARGMLKVFRSDGLAVDHVSCGQDALEVVKLEPYSAMILDLGLPDIDGLTVLKRIRQAHVNVPVLILTARDGTMDRVTGLDQGADDYLSKPFAVEELEARVRALIRRGQGNPDPVVRLGTLTLDRATGAAYIGGVLLELTRRERAVLETLAVRVGSVVPKARLAADVFGYDDAVAPNALEVYVARLRRKLENSGIEILTVRGLGYLLRLA